jgi:UDP-N-acetylmuramoyl-L-alanyl-D-glutamate--2,6-diaminopimelate ligase
MSVALRSLLHGIASVPDTEARVLDLTLDSREVRPGSLFVALAGHQVHGLQFVAEAVARGASAVLWEPGAAAAAPSLPGSVFGAPVPGLRDLLGRIADRFFDAPASQLRIAGITGTNGKTTCAYLLAQCLDGLGVPGAYMGTIGWGRPTALTPPTHTTPDVISVHRQLAHLRDSGVRAVAMEVSSHALDQARVAAVRFETAAFTNLTRDHLDYHGSMAAYGEAKKKLLQWPLLGHAVVNIGDAFGRAFAQSYTGPAPLTAVWVGDHPAGLPADRTLNATEITPQRDGLAMQLCGSFGRQSLKTRLLGRFNAENSVVVIACLLSMGVTLPDAAEALACCLPPPGRMELIEAPGNRTPDAGAPSRPAAIVDYAHTPDALAKALAAAREHCQGDLWCVFGCGGDRDPGKRPIMGAIADELADRIIVTDDNPRSENPRSITQAIESGIKSHTARVIHDRGEAIATALTEAAPPDLVLIAGKGHEDIQIYGDTRRAWSDRREAMRILGVAA